MSNDDIRRIEVITGVARRRYWPAHEKLRIIEESLAPGESVSAVARRFRRMAERRVARGGTQALRLLNSGLTCLFAHIGLRAAAHPGAEGIDEGGGRAIAKFHRHLRDSKPAAEQLDRPEQPQSPPP